jgi:hypothetical protein
MFCVTLFFRNLTARGPCHVELVTSDARAGLPVSSATHHG